MAGTRVEYRRQPPALFVVSVLGLLAVAAGLYAERFPEDVPFPPGLAGYLLLAGPFYLVLEPLLSKPVDRQAYGRHEDIRALQVLSWVHNLSAVLLVPSILFLALPAISGIDWDGFLGRDDRLKFMAGMAVVLLLGFLRFWTQHLLDRRAERLDATAVAEA